MQGGIFFSQPAMRMPVSYLANQDVVLKSAIAYYMTHLCMAHLIWGRPNTATTSHLADLQIDLPDNHNRLRFEPLQSGPLKHPNFGSLSMIPNSWAR